MARWENAPGQGGITTQGDSFAELDAMITDAVNGFFEPAERPQRLRLHFVEDPIVALAPSGNLPDWLNTGDSSVLAGFPIPYSCRYFSATDLLRTFLSLESLPDPTLQPARAELLRTDSNLLTS